MELNSNSRVAFVCKGGPENGPFSALACRILSERLNKEGIKVSAIYASSGSIPTALLGCTGDFSKLCDVWANLTPEDIVGKMNKAKTTMRLLWGESILLNNPLRNLIRKNWDLEKIFSDEALPIKFPAVDLCGSEYVIFSNKNPKHKKWFSEGVLGSMGLVPFLPPQRIFNPEEAGLTYKGQKKENGLLLIDGGFMGNILLEEAIRDQFDVVFLIDIHGLKSTETDFNVNKSYHWAKLLRSGFHILSNTNDVRQFQLADRINEEIRIKKELIKVASQMPPEYAKYLDAVICRMDEDRLRLWDKNETQIYTVSNEEQSTLFNFASFKKHKETLQFLSAGYEAANRTLKEIGLD